MRIVEIVKLNKDIPEGHTILAYLPDLGADGVLILKWAKDPKWVEVRGENVWGDYDPDNPLQHVLDRLMGPHVAWLFAGQIVNIHPGHPDYAFAKSFLAEPPSAVPASSPNHEAGV